MHWIKTRTAVAFFGAVVFAGVANTSWAGDTWQIDPAHSAARFKIRHMMISNVSGEITGMKGTFNSGGKDMTKLSADVTLDASTINTNNEKRDTHLKSPDFFDVAKYPTITFKSTKVVKEKGNHYKMMGALTMHGVTKDVTLEDAELTKSVKDPWGNMRVAFTAKTKINRKDFGLTWNKALETGGVVVGDVADVELEVEAIQPAKKSAEGR